MAKAVPVQVRPWAPNAVFSAGNPDKKTFCGSLSGQLSLDSLLLGYFTDVDNLPYIVILRTAITVPTHI